MGSTTKASNCRGTKKGHEILQKGNDSISPKDKNKNNCCGNIKLFRIRLLGHCIFCLRKTSNMNTEDVTMPNNANDIELLEKVPKVESSSSSQSSASLIATFNQIWPYIQTQENGGEEENTRNFIWGPVTVNNNKVNKKSKTSFSRLPRMCQFCWDKLVAVDKLWKELSVQIIGLKSVIKESKYGGVYSWRAKNFEKTLKSSSLEECSIRAVLEFLDLEFTGEKIIEKGGNRMEGERHSSMEFSTPECKFPTASECFHDNNGNDLSPGSSSSPVTNPQLSAVINVPHSQKKRLSRQDSIELPNNRAHICQQSTSDILTSPENCTSLDAVETETEEEGEQADDESGPDYINLDYEGLSSSEFDTTENDNSKAPSSLSSEEQSESLVPYSNLTSRTFGNNVMGIYKNLTSSSKDSLDKG